MSYVNHKEIDRCTAVLSAVIKLAVSYPRQQPPPLYQRQHEYGSCPVARVSDQHGLPRPCYLNTVARIRSSTALAPDNRRLPIRLNNHLTALRPPGEPNVLGRPLDESLKNQQSATTTSMIRYKFKRLCLVRLYRNKRLDQPLGCAYCADNTAQRRWRAYGTGRSRWIS
jgi:hypothetical protein